MPEFTEGYLLDAIETIPEEKFGSLNSLRGEVCRAIFDPALYPTKLNQKAGDDLLLTSSSNYYHNVSQAEAEAFYADMAVRVAPGAPRRCGQSRAGLLRPELAADEG